MKKIIILCALTITSLTAHAQDATSYTELLPFVQASPDQGENGTCLFMASTGAMELILNKKYNVTNPQPNGPYDLSEPYLIHQPAYAPRKKSFLEEAVYKFNRGGVAVPNTDWAFNAWNGDKPDLSAWRWQDSSKMNKIVVPEIETILLFDMKSRYATYVLQQSHVKQIKEALLKYKSPILVNYNDDFFWHVVLIVGFDDNIQGDCHEITEEECQETTGGSFYVRNSFGKSIEIRDYDWFKIKGNAAFVVTEKK